MRSKNWQQVESIFHTALALGGDERISYLSEKCSGNTALLSEVESLLGAFENKSEFLEDSAFSLGMNVLGQDDDKDLTGEKIGFYEIKEKLGGGGMGNVYLAEDTRLNRKVALKFLKKTLADDKWAKKQFITEAQAVARLEHPNICAVHSIEEIDEHNFIVMQYIEGATLGEIIPERQLTLEKILSVVNQIVSAVAAAHSHGIIHRDIKPGNIMITPEGLVKVLDFGLAKVVEKKQKRAEENISQMSQNGLILGTVSYMSPEQLRGEKLDYRSDIFSVGIVLYEMLTGERPFHRKSQAETIAALLNNEPPPLKENGEPISNALGVVMQKCLHKNKEERFQSAAEILVELDNAENAVGTVSKPRRNFLVKTAFAAFLFFAVLAVIFFYPGYPVKSAQKTLAVLPISFENPPPAEKEYLADGLTQSIIDKLSMVSDLNVKHESTIARYKGKAVEPQSAGKELNVDAVLVGNIQKRGEELVLVTKLIRTSDGAVIDPSEFKIEETHLGAFEENLSTHVADKIKSGLSADDKTKLAKKDTESDEAKTLYLRGRFYLKRKTHGDDVEKAIQAFTEAKDLDKNFAKAWAGLADAYLSQSAPGVKNSKSPADGLNLAKISANKAIELDSTLSEAYISLGWISSRYEWNWSAAENYFRTAINYNPESPSAHLGLLSVFKTQARYEEAFEQAQKIKDFDPLSIPADIQIALLHYRKHEYEQMDKVLSEVLQRSPDDIRVKYVRVYQFLKTDKLNEAADILELIYRSEKVEDKVFAAAPLGFVYGKMGRRTDALKIIDDLDKFGQSQYIPIQEKALIYVGLGEYDKVFQILNVACSERYSSLPGWINDPIIDEVKSDSRFPELKKCVNL